MSGLELKFSEVRTIVANQYTRRPILLHGKHLNLREKTMGQSHTNLLSLLSNGDTTSSPLESTRGSQASRNTWIYGCFNKIWGTRARDLSNLIKDGGTTA
jgi:hypothetical protein